MTVLSSVNKCQQMSPPMIIFRGKVDQTVRNLTIPSSFIVKIDEKPWVGYDLMKIWVEEIWLKHTWAECNRSRFQNSMLSFGAFAAHLSNT